MTPNVISPNAVRPARYDHARAAAHPGVGLFVGDAPEGRHAERVVGKRLKRDSWTGSRDAARIPMKAPMPGMNIGALAGMPKRRKAETCPIS